MPTAPDKGSQRPNAKVLLLDQYDKTLLSASFLSQVAAGLFLCTLIFSFFILIGLSNGSFGTVDTSGFLFLIGVFFLILATLFAWSCAITYMWQPAILVITLTICLALAAMATVIAADAAKSLPNDTFKVAEAFFGSIFSIFLAFRILLDGCRLTATRPGERALFAADPGSRGVRQSLAAVLGIHPICRWIPDRSRRVIAETLFLLATVITGFGIALVITLLVIAGGWLINLQGSASMIGFYVGILISATIFAVISNILRVCARRFARVSAENLINSDQRPPILFLRSFKDDQVPLAQPKRGFIRRLFGEPLRPMLDHVLLEEFTPLGPLVAIGVPGAAAPFGVSRTYVNDDEWKNVVAQLAKDARAIVIVLDDTEGVNWEISHIVQVGHLAKTLCFLPPRLADRSDAAAQFIRRALVDNECTLAAPLNDPCVGWYRTPDGGMVLLASSVPDQSSYVCALRLFRQRDSIGPITCGPS